MRTQKRLRQVCLLDGITNGWLCVWNQGNPSKRLIRFLAELNLPIAAWCDLDAYGIRMIHNMQKYIGNPITPVGMSVDLWRSGTKLDQTDEQLAKARQLAARMAAEGPPRCGSWQRQSRRPAIAASRRPSTGMFYPHCHQRCGTWRPDRNEIVSRQKPRRLDLTDRASISCTPNAPGRLSVPDEVRALVKQMARQNPRLGILAYSGGPQRQADRHVRSFLRGEQGLDRPEVSDLAKLAERWWLEGYYPC